MTQSLNQPLYKVIHLIKILPADIKSMYRFQVLAMYKLRLNHTYADRKVKQNINTYLDIDMISKVMCYIDRMKLKVCDLIEPDCLEVAGFYSHSKGVML